jgi:hypothetical protein
MAAVASRRQSRVITGAMATDVRAGAGRDGMRTLQRERGRAVIECRRGPPSGRVAVCAIRKRKRRTCRLMWWIIRLLPGRQMASRAAARRRQAARVIVVHVARSAGRGHVEASKREIRLRVVIERCRGPRSGVVAIRAVRKSKRRPGGLMRRIIRLLPSR